MRRLGMLVRGLSHNTGARLLALSLLLCLSLCPAQPLTAQDSATVRTELAVLEIGQGQVETVNIVLENAQEVYGIEVRARFDPAVVEIVDADPDHDGIQMIPGTFVQPDFAVRNVADNQAGTLQYVVTQTNPTPPVNGTGIVFSVQFRGKALGAQTELEIDFVDIADRQGVKLSVQPQSGVLQVVDPKPETPTPVPAATEALPATEAPPAAAPTSAAATAPLATSVSVAPVATPDSPRQTTGENWLTVIAGIVAATCCLGAFAVLGVAGFVLLRRQWSSSEDERYD